MSPCNFLNSLQSTARREAGRCWITAASGRWLSTVEKWTQTPSVITPCFPMRKTGGKRQIQYRLSRLCWLLQHWAVSKNLSEGPVMLMGLYHESLTCCLGVSASLALPECPRLAKFGGAGKSPKPILCSGISYITAVWAEPWACVCHYEVKQMIHSELPPPTTPQGNRIYLLNG